MKHLQQLTRSYVTLGLFALVCITGVSGTAFADEDMGKSKTMNEMMVVNVNVATAKQLETLPGIGKELAKRIIDYRTSNGKFNSVQELVKVKGIGKGTLAKMEERLTTGTDTPQTHMSQ